MKDMQNYQKTAARRSRLVPPRAITLLTARALWGFGAARAESGPAFNERLLGFLRR
jgi:hypothetical protein